MEAFFDLESIHHILELYLWFSNRLPVKFPLEEKEAATAALNACSSLINEALKSMSFKRDWKALIRPESAEKNHLSMADEVRADEEALDDENIRWAPNIRRRHEQRPGRHGRRKY